MTTPPRRDAQAELVAWAEAADAWVRWIVGEVVASGTGLGDAGVEEAYQRLLAEKGLSDKSFDPAPAFGSNDGRQIESEAFLLRSLAECEGVNALAPGQTINFNERMTVLFGENASGKTGYVRIVKRLASGRSQEPVLGNVYTSETGAPAARVTYSIGGEDNDLEWRGEGGMPPFTRIAIFDARAVSIHLDNDLTYVFTPAELALFTFVHGAIDAVRTKAEGAADDARPRANPFLPRFQRGTEVYRHVETLGASTDVAALEQLAEVPDDIRDELERRRARVEALRPESVASRLEIARGDRDLYESLLRLCEDAETFDVDRYSAALTRANRAATEFERVTATAMSTARDLPVREAEAFIRAGEALLAASGRDSYPLEGDECIYCEQALGPDAVTTVTARRSWVNDASSGERDTAFADATAAASTFRRLPLGQLAERIALKSSASSSPLPVLVDASVLVSAIADALEKTAERSDVSWDRVCDGIERVCPLATVARDAAVEVVTALETQESERAEALEVQRAQLAELESRGVLVSLMSDIRTFVQRAQWADRLSTVLRPINPDQSREFVRSLAAH